MDRGKIKTELEACEKTCLDVLPNVVVGDCPTRIGESSTEVEEAFERLRQVLRSEGVLRNDNKRVQDLEE